MLRRLRRLREHIRYHSASRPTNGWSRAMDIAFIATFLLSAPAAFVADLSSREVRSTVSVSGIFAQPPSGPVAARLMESASGPGGAAGGNGRGSGASDNILGNFNLTVFDHLRGWPLVTTIERQPARLTIDIIAEPKARLDVPRDASDAHQRAIESSLKADGHDDTLAAWNLREPEARRQWWAWFPAIGAWWILMFALAGITIQFLRFGSLWLRGKRMERAYRRRAENQCSSCGYDLTGLEFNERCPECGSQVW